MKLLAFALIGMITCGAASAETVAPFSSDGCVPGYTAQGQFVDEQGNVLDSAGWVATPEKKVLDAAGKQVFLKKGCSGIIHTSRSGVLGLAARSGGLVWAGVGALVVSLAAGGSSSTGSTTGTTN